MERTYLNYTVEDFVQDTFFREWVTDPTDQHHAFWTAWLELHPEKKSTVEEARTILLSLTTQALPSVSEHMQQDWPRIQAAMAETDTAVKRFSTQRTWYAVAATVLLLIGAGMAFWWLTVANSWTNIRTAYGQTQTVQLADGSEVILNGNSRLRYASSWQDTAALREVWLAGEAYFSVVHTATDQRFIVHLDEVEIEVLGTEFNVQNRSGKTQVVLSKGKVRLQAKQAGKNDTVVMRPGDLVEFTQDQFFSKKEVQPDTYSSWRKGLLTFDQATLGEVIAVLENNYGYRIDLNNPAWNDLEFTAQVASDNPDLLLELLAESFDFALIQQDKTITVKKRSGLP